MNKRKSPAGKPTNDLVLSAMTGDNAALFPQILKLYVPEGGRVADVTYGRGVFWKNIPEKTYNIWRLDINEGVDCRKLPYLDCGFDALILDPPYMHSPGGSATGGIKISRATTVTTLRNLPPNITRLCWNCILPPPKKPIEFSKGMVYSS
jgi:hypothetical protein